MCGVWIVFKSVTDAKFGPSEVTFLRLCYALKKLTLTSLANILKIKQLVQDNRLAWSNDLPSMEVNWYEKKMCFRQSLHYSKCKRTELEIHHLLHKDCAPNHAWDRRVKPERWHRSLWRITALKCSSLSQFQICVCVSGLVLLLPVSKLCVSPRHQPGIFL